MKGRWLQETAMEEMAKVDGNMNEPTPRSPGAHHMGGQNGLWVVQFLLTPQRVHGWDVLHLRGQEKPH